jgi:predicted ArsR family transcriptional regulator
VVITIFRLPPGHVKTYAALVDSWQPVEALADPRRRAVYAAVRAADEPVSRDQVAHQLGISRQAAALALDRLAGAGLLAVSYARPPGRRGPGAGRPAKRYQPSGTAVAVAVPARREDLPARILAEAVTGAGSPREAVGAIATREGRSDGNRLRAPEGSAPHPADAEPVAALEALGYEPECVGGQVVLRNCPFHRVVGTAPELVCGLNLAYLDGLLEGLGANTRYAAELVPGLAGCCVAVRPLP